MEREEQRNLAGRALFAKVLADLAAAEVRASRKALEPTLVPGEKIKGVLPDGQIVGDVKLTEQPISVAVVDEAALFEYVKRTRPEEIVTTARIRESYLTYLKTMAREQLVEDEYGGDVVDSQGEFVPGLDLDYGTPRYTPTVAPTGKRAIHAALRRLVGPELAERLGLPHAAPEPEP